MRKKTPSILLVNKFSITLKLVPNVTVVSLCDCLEGNAIQVKIVSHALQAKTFFALPEKPEQEIYTDKNLWIFYIYNSNRSGFVAQD